MKLKLENENGNNIEPGFQQIHSYELTDNRSWADSSNIVNNPTRRNSINRNPNNDNTTNEIIENNSIDYEAILEVYNKHYKLLTEDTLNTLNSRRLKEVENLEDNSKVVGEQENFYEPSDSHVPTIPADEERAFDQSDTDEMSDSLHRKRKVPRGIVNPNYPGFQHLAHTLQDYSSTIENFYQSENDMTDDDIDVEITDLTTDSEIFQYEENEEISNNNNNNPVLDDMDINSTFLADEFITSVNVGNKLMSNDIPDLLKTVARNNNDVDFSQFDNYSEKDIENNFNTKDIIGDFNKEIEDEIRELLNYNINIQDDLEELRNDIKNTFAKPIENTINNISEVVNQVIKKLVETQSDEDFNFDQAVNETLSNNYTNNENLSKIITVASESNGNNRRTEMNVSRPTFLLLENKSNTIEDAYLSDVKDEIMMYDEYDAEALSNNVENTIKQLSNELRKIIPKLEEMKENDKLWKESTAKHVTNESNFNKIASTSDTVSVVPDQKTKTEVVVQKTPTNFTKTEPKKEVAVKESSWEVQSNSVHKSESSESELGFDVYNIETALPKLDFDAIESHLKAAKEEERRKRNDREEIRKRLAMEADDEYFSMGHTDRPNRKPSLHSRLQSGKNLQICFMNEQASDNESQASDIERSTNSSKSLSRSSLFSKSSYSLYNHPYQTRPLSVSISKHDKISTMGAKLRPSLVPPKPTRAKSTNSLNNIDMKESDFYALQATLQTEARIALAQAKELARVQMERERRTRPVSPVTEMLRRSLLKAHAPLAPNRRRVSRLLLTDMNVAQLQVIVNELHSEIEGLNDALVKLLMARDELHMTQDSMLVDIEDLTRYLGVKEQSKKAKAKSGVRRLTSFVHK